MGVLSSGPAIAASINAQSETVRAMGPRTLRLLQPSGTGYAGTRPALVLNPTTLQKLAGLRSEPPMSLPSASGSILAASATAAPPELPPHVRVRSNGFFVSPKTSLKVCEPAPHSGTFVFPIVTPPASTRRWTISAFFLGTKFSNNFEPKVVLIALV